MEASAIPPNWVTPLRLSVTWPMTVSPPSTRGAIVHTAPELSVILAVKSLTSVPGAGLTGGMRTQTTGGGGGGSGGTTTVGTTFASPDSVALYVTGAIPPAGTQVGATNVTSSCNGLYGSVIFQ